MPFNASQFRSELKFGGARSNLFEVSITFPEFADGQAAGSKALFMCKASQIPGMNVAEIEQKYFGRTIKLAGDRTFEEWTVTVINDEDFLVRNALEKWSNGMSQINYDTETSRTPQAIGVNSYVANIDVKQYGKDGSVAKTYSIKNAFPTVIAPIELSWDNENQIEEYDATFVFDYFITDSIQ